MMVSYRDLVGEASARVDQAVLDAAIGPRLWDTLQKRAEGGEVAWWRRVVGGVEAAKARVNDQEFAGIALQDYFRSLVGSVLFGY